MAKVTKVLDGNTFDIESGQRILLANVNVPEDGKPRADEATAKLRELVVGKNVRIEPVGTSYGRVVANVTVDLESVNSAMYAFINPLRSWVLKIWEFVIFISNPVAYRRKKQEAIDDILNRPVRRLK